MAVQTIILPDSKTPRLWGVFLLLVKNFYRAVSSHSSNTCHFQVIRVCGNILSHVGILLTTSTTLKRPWAIYCWYGRLSPFRNPLSRSLANIRLRPIQNFPNVAFANCSTVTSLSEFWMVLANSTRGASMARTSWSFSSSSCFWAARYNACEYDPGIYTRDLLTTCLYAFSTLRK